MNAAFNNGFHLDVAHEVRPSVGPDWELRAIVEQAIDASERSERAERAYQFWMEHTLAAKDTPTQIYLRQTREIEILAGYVRHSPQDCAMAIAVRDVNGCVRGYQLTYLTPDGKKASITPNKRTFGPLMGNACWLAPAGETLLLCEGVEDALSIIQLPDKPPGRRWDAATWRGSNCRAKTRRPTLLLLGMATRPG